jgi:hypothetical protein
MKDRVGVDTSESVTSVEIPRKIWDRVANAIHTTSINGNEQPITLAHLAVRVALKASGTQVLRDALEALVEAIPRDSMPVGSKVVWSDELADAVFVAKAALEATE